MNVLRTLLLAMLTLQSIAYAQEVNYYHPEDEQILQTRQNVGQEFEQNPISAWCDDRLRTLKRARNHASSAIYRGDYRSSVEILISGLVQASHNGYSMNPPFTQQAIDRGIKIGSTLMSYTGSQLNGMKAVSVFLESYYQFVEKVAAEIDVPFYRPGKCGYCGTNSKSMETSLIKMTKDQLSLVNDTLIAHGTVIPLGPSSLYLKAQEMLTYYASYDLRSSLMANAYSCQINDLMTIHDELRYFNSAPSQESEKRLMVWNIYQDMISINANIHSVGHCH